MKGMAFLLIMLCIFTVPSAMAWEAAVHAKGVHDICKAYGFSEADATLVGDGAWFDGNDLRFQRNEGEKDITIFRNQDRAFNTGVLAEGMPVKTYGKYAISPNDTRYQNSRKYLNKAIALMKEDKRGESLYALGVGVRALQNIFANRDFVNDAAWTTRAKMENGAGAWMPGLTFDSAWHNVDIDDDVFSDVHSDALKASLQATVDVVGEFLTACPQAVENVRQPSASTVDGIVAETVSLIPLREKLAQKVKQANRDIVRQLDKALATFPMAATEKERETQPPYALTIFPARRLVTFAKVTFRRKLEDMKIDVEEFSGSADAEWKAFEKTTEESLAKLRKASDDVAKALTDASNALKSASLEESYMVARKQLAEFSKTAFATLKPSCETEYLLGEQVTYWCEVLHKQIGEYTVSHDLLLLKNFYVLKTQLPKSETAFADFMTASEAALKEYTSRCDNALADFEQEMAGIAEAYGQNVDALKKSAAERVFAVRTVFDEKAKQAAESLKGIAPLKQGETVPKAVEDVIRSMMKDAKELKNNVFENIAPSISDSRLSDGDSQKARRLLAAHATRQDFLRPIDIGSRRPASWTPAVWNSDVPPKITYVKHKPGVHFDFDIPDQISNANDQKSTAEKGSGILTKPAKDAEAAKNGTTQETTNKVMGGVAGGTIGLATEKALTPILGGAGELIGSVRPGGGQVGKKIGEKTAEITSKVIQRVIEREGGEYIVKQIDDKYGEGATEAAVNDIIKFSDKYSEVKKKTDAVADVVTDVMAMTMPGAGALKMGEKIDSITSQFQNKYIIDPLIDTALDGIFGDDGANSDNETGLSEDLKFISNTLKGPKQDLLTGITQDVEKTMNEFDNKFDLNNPLVRPIALNWLENKLGEITGEINGMIGGLMDTISSITMQIQGVMMSIINLAVDLEHIDISSEMDDSLKVLTNDLNTMMGKDDEQDKSVVRKATIENKGRDLKRQSNSGGELKGTPAVKQIEMKEVKWGQRIVPAQ